MKKADHATPRESIRDFQEIVNVGPATAGDFCVLGLDRPAQLIGQDPLVLYRELTRRTGIRQDPCVLDVFIATTDFMNGNPPRAWWEFTEYRKQTYGDQVQALEDANVQASVDANVQASVDANVQASVDANVHASVDANVHAGDASARR